VIDRLYDAIAQALDFPNLKASFARLAFEVMVPPQYLEAFIAAEAQVAANRKGCRPDTQSPAAASSMLHASGQTCHD
jgi:hypothetical protein